jgi:hypothetical protein
MNYKYQEYLKSDHWIRFRREVLRIRKQCQYCASKLQLNIHHKHYKTVGHERNEDVIVLCQTCHLKLHKKKRWVKAKRSRELMDFTRAAKLERPIFNMSDVLRLCVRCGEKHPVFYRLYKYGERLVIACPNSKPRITQIAYEKNLPIPRI